MVQIISDYLARGILIFLYSYFFFSFPPIYMVTLLKLRATHFAHCRFLFFRYSLLSLLLLPSADIVGTFVIYTIVYVHILHVVFVVGRSCFYCLCYCAVTSSSTSSTSYTCSLISAAFFSATIGVTVHIIISLPLRPQLLSHPGPHSHPYLRPGQPAWALCTLRTLCDSFTVKC